ncbi:hypothetical protein [Chryseobacterium sp. JUb7]|uniref:hypothetical protein n=1 Tax=Chryseobacterium sp. JUb7 TaxID=2940599 RepID=UPI0021677454|nr:hypothetical protein [Chryseobacterium sp. JUb7]MCS3528884.1 hypothetical protein [Chryseobacterium sp. JUb7]
MNDFYILIIGFVTVFISVNAVLYFYLRNQHKKFFNYIKNRNYILIDKVETDIERYSKINTKLLYRKSNIVFLDDEIFILTHNKSTIQIGKSQEIFPGVFKRFTYQSKRKVNYRLEIKGTFNEVFIEGDYKIYLNLKDKNFDLEEYLKYPHS